MSYSLNPIVLEFPELGEGVRVRILNPLLLPCGASGLTGLALAAKGVGFNADGVPSLTLENVAEMNRRQATAAVLEWQGVSDPYTGDTLKLPREDPAAWDRCPSGIFDRIIAEIASARKAIEVPKPKPEQS